MTTTASRAFAALVLTAMAYALPARAAMDFGGLKYRGIGPAIAGGRTTAIVGSDGNPKIYYAGGAGGGVFKSSDGGASWVPVFDNEPVAPIGAIALAPHDASDVWVGTGEANPRNDVEQGDGIWHSSNGGNTWRHMGLDDAGSISAISIDPRNPRHVAVAVLGQIFRDSTMRGIYVTTDGGAHWTRTLYVNAGVGASDLVRVPDSPNTLFAGMYYLRRMPWTMISGGPGGGIFRSDDNGMTWHKLAGHGLPGGPVGRIGLAAGTHGRIYADMQSRAGVLWRSDNGGTTWRLMPPSPLVGARRFYFSRITVDPANNDRLISVGLILSMTTNGGKTFHAISENAGWDYHQVWWSHDGTRVAVGSDEGAILSKDGGDRWLQPYDLPFAQPYHVSFDDEIPNYHVCIGLQDDNSWCGWANSPSGIGVLNRDWFQFAPGDGMWAMFDPLDHHDIWSTSTANDTGQVYLYDTHTHQVSEVSPDAESNGSLPARALHYRFNWDSPLAFTHSGAALVGGNVVFESTDRGQHWSVISPDLTRNDRAHQGIPGGPIDADMSGAETADNILDIETTAFDPSLYWVGTDDGLVQLTRDAGATWTNVTPPIFPHWGRVATVSPGAFDAATAFAAVDNHMLGDNGPHLFETTDYGAHWRSIDGNMPHDLYARVIRQDPVNARLIYAGTQRGIWASWDGGRHWQSLRLNMPATAIYDLHVQPTADDLVVAAHGRGVWILDDIAPLQHPANPQRFTLFPIRTTYRWSPMPPINAFHGQPTNQFVGPNAQYGALITYYLPRKTRHATIEILDASGRVVRHLSGKDAPGDRGLNRVAWDLAEDGPMKWHGTFKDNQGPDEGADVVPGTFIVRVRANGTMREQQVTVKQDPRDDLTIAQIQAHHDVLRQLLDEIGGVDTMLNGIDQRLKHASPAQRSRLLAFRARLTYDPRNVEDLSGPAGLREKLMDLYGRIGQSYQPATQPEMDQATAYHAQYDALATRWRALR
jgi:photosystem II stability/assembly factor-like uncharacterized protein